LKWYIEEETKELRQALEKEIIGLYKVTFKKMFGCPCYLANGKMFVGLVTKGVVITKFYESERKKLKKIHETHLQSWEKNPEEMDLVKN
jgi:TfoX/Sxy family transcriptional regulator of competence genes